MTHSRLKMCFPNLNQSAFVAWIQTLDVGVIILDFCTSTIHPDLLPDDSVVHKCTVSFRAGIKCSRVQSQEKKKKSVISFTTCCDTMLLFYILYIFNFSVCSVWGGVSTLVFWGGSLPRGPPPPPPQACPPSSPGPSEGTAAPASNRTMKHSPAGTPACTTEHTYFSFFHSYSHLSFVFCLPYYPRGVIQEKDLLCSRQSRRVLCLNILIGSRCVTMYRRYTQPRFKRFNEDYHSMTHHSEEVYSQQRGCSYTKDISVSEQ